MVREDRHWLERSVTGKRRASLVREKSHWVEEGHCLERSVTG